MSVINTGLVAATDVGNATMKFAEIGRFRIRQEFLALPLSGQRRERHCSPVDIVEDGRADWQFGTSLNMLLTTCIPKLAGVLRTC